MTAVEPRILREVGGLVVAEAGPLVLVVDRGNAPPAILAFVAGVLALVFGGFGAVTLAAAAAGHDSRSPSSAACRSVKARPSWWPRRRPVPTCCSAAIPSPAGSGTSTRC